MEKQFRDPANGGSVTQGAASMAVSSRVDAIDVARGAAMFFVCLSHFSGAYLWGRGTRAADLLATISMVASPSFVLISGLTFGFLAALDPREAHQLRIRLLDRGVFLILIGHFLLTLSQLQPGHGLLAAYPTSFITDAIGVLLIVGPLIVARTSHQQRASLAFVLFGTSWLLVTLWHPTLLIPRVIKHYAIGGLWTDPTAPRMQAFPVLPWLSIYLVGTILGARVVSDYRAAGLRRAPRALLVGGASLMVVGSVVYLLTRRVLAISALAARSSTFMALTSPAQKFPPGPTYLAFFGGAASVFMAFVLYLHAWRFFPWLTESLRRAGYASLPVFLLQSFVYSSVLRHLNLPYTAWWPVLFIITLAPLWLLARVWVDVKGNRFLTIGILVPSAFYREGRNKKVVRTPFPAPAFRALASIAGFRRFR